MSQRSEKLGFWSMFSLVTGSQIGSGVFMLPASLAPYGIYSLMGWLLSGVGAIALALVFAKLCAWFPRTGGPHVYVEQAFGKTAAFFTGWTYWVISWISTTIVIIASIGYLTPLLGTTSVTTNLILEIFLLVIITLLNFKGVAASGRIEFVLTLLKILSLCVIPLLALFYFNADNFYLDPIIAQLPLSHVLSRVALLTLWGFIGLESATTPAESVQNPSRTIPLAIVLGTVCTALLYIFNSVGLMGIIPGQQLMLSNAPYSDAAAALFGGNFYLMISLIASIICIGTLNAWMLTSGQIILGLAQDRLMPSLFAKKNSYDAPYWGLAVSCLGIIPLLMVTIHESLAVQVLRIIDFSVIAFLFVYAICCLAFLYLLLRTKDTLANKLFSLLYGIIALIFCCWVIYETPFYVLAIASLFVVSGIPLYLYYLASDKSMKHS